MSPLDPVTVFWDGTENAYVSSPIPFGSRRMLTIKTSPKDLRHVLSLRTGYEADTPDCGTRHPFANPLTLRNKNLEQRP